MKRVGTGESKFPAFRSVPDAARYVLELVIVAASYVGLAEAGLMLPSINPTATPLWPPSGFALALLLLRGYRIWPAILLGSFFSNAIAARSLLASGFIGVGMLFAAFTGAWLIGRWSNGRKTFETPVDVATFAIISFAPTAIISSTVATAEVVLANDISFANSFGWTIWWLADAAGCLIIAPVIVLWAMRPLLPFSKWHLMEAIAIFILAAAIGFIAFGPQPHKLLLNDLQPYRSLFGFLILFPLMWTGLRGNQRNAATAVFIFCGMAVWGFAIGGKPFLKTDLDGSLLTLLALLIAHHFRHSY